jgi:hypothetical protein
VDGEAFFVAHELCDGAQVTFLFRDRTLNSLVSSSLYLILGIIEPHFVQSSKPAFSLALQTQQEANHVQSTTVNLTTHGMVLRVSPHMGHLSILVNFMTSPENVSNDLFNLIVIIYIIIIIE